LKDAALKRFRVQAATALKLRAKFFQAAQRSQAAEETWHESGEKSDKKKFLKFYKKFANAQKKLDNMVAKCVKKLEQVQVESLKGAGKGKGPGKGKRKRTTSA